VNEFLVNKLNKWTQNEYSSKWNNFDSFCLLKAKQNESYAPNSLHAKAKQ